MFSRKFTNSFSTFLKNSFMHFNSFVYAFCKFFNVESISCFNIYTDSFDYYNLNLYKSYIILAVESTILILHI